MRWNRIEGTGQYELSSSQKITRSVRDSYNGEGPLYPLLAGALSLPQCTHHGYSHAAWDKYPTGWWCVLLGVPISTWVIPNTAIRSCTVLHYLFYCLQVERIHMRVLLYYSFIIGISEQVMRHLSLDFVVSILIFLSSKPKKIFGEAFQIILAIAIRM
ncbi:hypothetical protein VNO77_11203 [Canavalia gladiata]|uniref:Uncharacterized protein n=1 Tax=Canavalia gladiata TaxID=3824 RepID=A0AAN9QY88_CANGL